MIGPCLEDALIACYQRFSLIGASDTHNGYVCIAPKWKEGKDLTSGGQFQPENVDCWIAGIGEHEAKGSSPIEAVMHLYEELGKACKRMARYHESALRYLSKEIEQG